MEHSNGTLYHCSDVQFTEGDKLVPKLKETMESWDTYEQFVEQVFEQVRQNEFPDRPSRLESVFLTTHLKYFPLQEYCYEVDCTGNRFKTDQDLHSSASVFRQCRPDIKKWARKYWSGSENPETPEVLVKGEVTITKIVDKALFTS